VAGAIACGVFAGCALWGSTFDGYFLDEGTDAGSDAGTDVEASTLNDGPTADTSRRDSEAGGCTANLQADQHNCGTCGHDCLRGVCAAGACQPWTIASGETGCQGNCFPDSVVATSRSLYWAYYAQGGIIYRYDLVGDGGVVKFATSQDIAGGLVTDPAFVYWGTASQIIRCPLQSCGGSAQPYEPGSYAPSNIALTDAAVYWSDQGDGGAAGIIWSSDKPAFNPSPTPIVTNQLTPGGVVVLGSSLYWINAGSPANNHKDGTVMQAGLDGSNPHAIASSQAWPASLVAYGNQLYWTNFGSDNATHTDGAVMTCNPQSCTPTPLATGQGGAQGLAVDATGAYWTNSWPSAGAPPGALLPVMRCTPPVVGCVPTVIATGPNLQLLTANDKAIYWTDASGTVRGLAK
jgi:hypothetical protein